jgi:hypothetical protein
MVFVGEEGCMAVIIPLVFRLLDCVTVEFISTPTFSFHSVGQKKYYCFPVLGLGTVVPCPGAGVAGFAVAGFAAGFSAGFVAGFGCCGFGP